MESYLDTKRLAALVRTKRGTKGLREVASEIGNLSPSTLSRVENNSTPDMETFIALCNWLQVRPGDLFVSTEEPLSDTTEELDTAEEVAFLLLSDKQLDTAIAYVFGRIIKAAYRDLINK